MRKPHNGGGGWGRIDLPITMMAEIRARSGGYVQDQAHQVLLFRYTTTTRPDGRDSSGSVSQKPFTLGRW
jgi:hypothetical protein